MGVKGTTGRNEPDENPLLSDGGLLSVTGRPVSFVLVEVK